MKGYKGRILWADLSSGRTWDENLDPSIARLVLGGNGLAAWIVSQHVPRTADAFDFDNVLVFATGPVTDTIVWGSGRGQLGSISPQTGFFADSNFGGDFAVALKRAGCDALAVRGQADRPVGLLVDDGELRVVAAGDIWGHGVHDTCAWVKDSFGDKAECATIGPAGENRVRYASVLCSGKRLSAAGRCGFGAVMGSKRLKCVVARGGGKEDVADPEGLRKLLRTQRDQMRAGTKILTTHGTPFLEEQVNAKGMLGTHNASVEQFSGSAAISAEVLLEEFNEGNLACMRCPVACGKLAAVPSGAFAGRSVKAPEYETLYSLGSMLDNPDPISIINTNALCDDLGMDTISFGVTVSFLAECLESGAVSDRDVGFPVRFAAGEALPRLAELTGRCEGVGALLAMGSRRLSERLGAETQRFLYEVKGLEIAGHSARGLRNMSLGYATSTRGGSHHDARPDYAGHADGDPGFEGQAGLCMRSEHYTALGDSMVMCRFLMERGFGRSIDGPCLEAVRCVTGWDYDAAELERVGERVYNLERLINVRRGLDRRLDRLPQRVMTEPITDGPTAGRYCPEETLDAMLDEYYALRGWDERGVPTPEKLAELELPGIDGGGRTM